MSSKWLWLAIWALLWTCLAGCAQDPGRSGAYPIALPSRLVQPSSIQTPATALVLPELTASPFEDSSKILTPSPETAGLGLNQPVAQAQKETVKSAKKDLAQKLGISVKDITVLSVISQEYSPDAFYCRTAKGRIAKEEPPQVISGETILLKAQGNRYEYHASDQIVIFCRPLP